MLIYFIKIFTEFLKNDLNIWKKALKINGLVCCTLIADLIKIIVIINLAKYYHLCEVKIVLNLDN